MNTIKPILFLLIAIAMSGLAYGQFGTATATYNSGDIETDKNFTWYSGTESSECPGMMTVTIPIGAIIISTDVSYDMTSDENSSINKQKSHFRCVSPGGTSEASMTNSPGIYTPGTVSYSREGLDIANGVVGGGDIEFELHAGITYYINYCSIDSAKVDNNTWTVTITYIPTGYPAQSLNPIPADGSLNIGIDDDLSWDFGEVTDNYDIYFGTDNPPTTKVVDNALAGATGTYDPGAMNETETYYWQVVSRNANGYTYGPVWSFTTVCGLFVTPFTEDFESVTTPDLPYCWTSFFNSTGNYAKIETSIYGGNNDPKCIVMANGNDPDATLIFISPQIDVGTGSLADKMVHFYVKGESYPNFIVGTMSDPTDELTFTAYDNFYAYNTYQEHDIYLDDYSGTDTYIAFKVDVSTNYQAAYIDDITIDDIQTCIRPEDLFADNLTINSANLNWTELNGSTSWNIEYGLSGFVPTGVPTLSTDMNPYEISGLTSATAYDFYVQTDCGGGDLSAWSSACTFETPCDFYEVPFSENFDEVGFGEMPACWSSILLCADAFAWNGNQGGYFQMENSFDLNSTLMLISPSVLDLAPNRLKFNAQSNTEGAELLIGTMANPANQNTFELLTSVTFTTANTYEAFDVWLNGYTGTNNHFVIKHSNSSTYLTIYIDDIEVEALPTCYEPINLSVSDITTTSANFNWSEAGTSTNWEIEIGELGFVLGTGITYSYYNPTGTDQTYNLAGLTSATAYDIYIRADCGEGEYSDWVGPVTFLSGFDQFASIPISEDFESGMGISGNDPANAVNWDVNTALYHSGQNSVHNAYLGENDNILYMLGTFDFTGKTDVMLTFWQIAKTDGNNDHCYVEISTDGGSTYDQLPESTYAGAGWYREEGQYSPIEGPCFDEDSYESWGTDYETPDNSYWKKEYFNLTDYNTYSNVVIRFRLVSNELTDKAGWWIDDIVVESLVSPEFTVDPLIITENVMADNPVVNIDMSFGNAGGLPVSYTANVVYDESDLLFETFDTEIPSTWTIVNNGNNAVTWADTTGKNGYSFDGTRFVWVDGHQNYGPIGNLMDEELISPDIDASAYVGGTLQLEYDQAFDADFNPGDTARVYVYDGAEWIMIYESWEDDGILDWNINGVHKAYDVSMYANANFQIKFHYIEGSLTSRGQYFAIDNVRLRASMSPLGWLTLNGEEMISGISMPDADMLPSIADVQLDATNIEEGTYTADIEITSSDPANPSITVPVTFQLYSLLSGATAIADPAEICMGSSTQLSVELVGGSGAQTYSWTSIPEGFTSDLADPVVSPAEETTYYVEVSEGAITVSSDVTVVVNPLPEVTIGLFDDVCVDEGEFALTGGLPDGGEYIGMGVENGIFDPATAGIGTWTITYTYTNEFDCESFAEEDITVNDLPVVSMTELDTVCVGWDPVELTGGMPAGGVYSGTGVTNGMFDPATAGVGSHTITYTFIDTNGCENYTEEDIYVDFCTGINELLDNISIEVTPNPNNGLFNVKVSAVIAQELHIRIVNNLGLAVFEENSVSIDNKYSFDMNLVNESKGMYFIHVITDKSSYIQKVIVR